MMKIPINIWDDYHDDGVGKKQETFMCVESEIVQEKECLEVVLDWINKNVILDGVRFWLFFNDTKLKYPMLVGTEYESTLYQRWEIRIENLTHVQREQLVKTLNQANLTREGNPIYFFSES